MPEPSKAPQPPEKKPAQPPAPEPKSPEDDGLLCTFCGLRACWTK